MVKKDDPMEIKADPNNAKLVIYRGTGFGFLVVLNNYLDGKFIGQTKGKSFFVTTVNPGEHYIVGSGENNACAKVNFEAGKVYYLLQAIFPGFMKARTGFIGSNPEDFEKDKPDLTYYVLKQGEKFPQINKDTYNKTIQDHEKEMKEDPERHKDTSDLQGY
jgi:hypothetical protein